MSRILFVALPWLVGCSEDDPVGARAASGTGGAPSADAGSPPPASGGTVTAPPRSPCDGMPAILCDDFDDGNFQGWRAIPDDGRLFTVEQKVASPGAAATSFAAEITANALQATSNWGMLMFTVPQAMPTTLDFWARAGSTDTVAVLGLDLALSVGFWEDGLLYGVGDSAPKYEKDRWYHFEVTNLDWASGTYSAAVDGTLLATGIPIPAPSSDGIASVRLGVRVMVPGAKTAAWDQIVVR